MQHAPENHRSSSRFRFTRAAIFTSRHSSCYYRRMKAMSNLSPNQAHRPRGCTRTRRIVAVSFGERTNGERIYVDSITTCL
jgi:hypothetical protein